MENQTMDKINNFSDKLHNLFSLRKQKDIDSSAEMQQNNSAARRVGETYEQWGTRICGIVTGSLSALPPYMQKVYHHIYREQADNVELQESARTTTQAEIDMKNDEIKNLHDKIENANSFIENIKKKIVDLQNEKQEIKHGKEKVNTEQRLKMIIGLVILFPLTIYLFLFYSSTFYSAFFRDPSSMTTVMNSMFDSNAIANAYMSGLSELGFVLSAPIIFLGLGFALHFFSMQETKIKYLKMVAILLVTLSFDCILAYKIGDQLHTFGIMIGQYPINEIYTVKMAIHDINTWAVIFCGFIVYIIWGIVFDMSMDAFNKMDWNKTRLDSIEADINKYEEEIQDTKTKIQKLRQQENDMKNTVTKLLGKLGHTVYVDYDAIRTEMNNFFAGWIKQMQVLSIDQNDQNEASKIYQDQIKTLIPQKNEI